MQKIRFPLGLCPPPDPVAIFKGPTSKGRERDRGREEGGEGEGTGREGQEKRKGRNGRGQASQIFRPRIAPVHKARKHARLVTDSLTHSFASLLGRIACNAQMRLVATDVARALSRCVYCFIGEHRWVLQKRLDRLRCRLASKTKWAQVSDGCAHWRHLANMIEPFVHGGDAALCQITLTTWQYS